MEYLIMLDIRRVYGKLLTTVYHYPDGSVFISANKTELKETIQRLESDPQISNVYPVVLKKAKL